MGRLFGGSVYTPSTPRKNCAHVYSKHFPAQMKREYRYVILRLMSPIQYKEGGNSVLQKKKPIRKAKDICTSSYDDICVF